MVGEMFWIFSSYAEMCTAAQVDLQDSSSSSSAASEIFSCTSCEAHLFSRADWWC